MSADATRNNALSLIAARLAAPKRFSVTVTYSSGRTYVHETETLEQARNHSRNFTPKIGRDLIERETGKPVQIVSVTISPL